MVKNELHELARANDAAGIARAVARGVDVNARDPTDVSLCVVSIANAHQGRLGRQRPAACGCQV
jgi:hypothetical protein